MAEENTLYVRTVLLGQKQFAAGTAFIRKEIASVAAEAETANLAMKKTTFNAGLLGRGLHLVARAGHAAGLGLIAAGAGAAVAGVNLEQEMQKVASVVDLTSVQYDKLTQRALVAATETRFSATEAAEGMYLLGRSGFQYKEILDTLPGTLALAHASGIDLASAARIQTEALRGFNLEASQAGHVADVLARATRGGNLSMQDLQYTIKYVGAASFSTGQQMEDMVGLIETMARHGIRGTQAGTSLRTMLTRLVDPVKQTRDGLDMLNISSRDLYGPHGLRPLPQILEKIRTQADKLDPVSREMAIHKISGQWAFSGISAIINTDPKIIHGFIKNLRNSSGTAKEMAEILNNSVRMQLLRFWHTLEAIGQGIYMALRPEIKNALKDINHWLKQIVLAMPELQKYIKAGDWDGFVKKLDEITGSGGHLIEVWQHLQHTSKEFWIFAKNVIFPIALQWAKIIGGVLYVALILLDKILTLANHHTRATKFILGTLLLMYLQWKIYTLAVTTALKIQSAFEAVALFRTRMLWLMTKAIAIGMRLWAASIWLVNIALDANPIVLIILAVIALGVALVILYKKWGWFHNAVDKTYHFIKNNWPLLLGILLGPFELAAILIYQHWDMVERFLMGFPDRMKGYAVHMWDWLLKSFSAALNWMIDKWNAVASQIGFNLPNLPGTNFGGGHHGLSQIGHVNLGPSPTASHALPPKVLDPKGPTGPMGPMVQPTVSVQIDGKEVAKAVAKHNATRQARR